MATFIATTWPVARLRNWCDFRAEYHEIEKEQEIVSENEEARNVSLARRKYLLVWLVLAILDMGMSDRTDRFLS